LVSLLLLRVAVFGCAALKFYASSYTSAMLRKSCIAGLFYWISDVQQYDSGGWNYLHELHKFVDNGMEGDAFINAVSGIVNRVRSLEVYCTLGYILRVLSMFYASITYINSLLHSRLHITDRAAIIQ